MKIRILAIAGATAVAAASSTHASLFMTTGQAGAQVQVDINHTQYWTYTVPGNVSDLVGAMFTMKRGSQTTASIGFELFEGTIDDFATSDRILSVVLGPESFSQSYDWVRFESTPVSLIAGRTYTGVLYSDAPDMQSAAYFIKGGGESQLYFTDGEVPAPGALALLGLAGIVGSRRRR